MKTASSRRGIRHLKSWPFPLRPSSLSPLPFFPLTLLLTIKTIPPTSPPSHESWPKPDLASPRPLVPTGKISSPRNSFNPPPLPPSVLLTEDLNFGPASSNSPSFQPTATIYSNPFYTTASQTPSWLPSTPNSNRTAASPDQQNATPASQNDFVLFPQQARRSFEAAPSARSTPSLSDSQALSGSYRRHSSHLPSAQTLQNQRVAAIIQGTGHSTTSTAFTNRHTSAQNQFYASSAPSSSAALQAQQTRPKPQVPLFSQSTGNIHRKQPFPSAPMAQDMDLFDDYSPFEMDASTRGSFHPAYSSPAVPTTYDLNMARTDSSSTNVGTVSPQDLMVRDPSFSAPNSTAFTNLTSPSIYNTSPDFNDGYEVSPMFGNTDLDPSISDPWYPLFPDANNAVDQSPADQSPLQPNEELEVSEHLRNSHRRSGSSPGSNKASTSSGVSARKRNQPLPPILVDDPSDTVAIKRARNTLAARKSRQKKMERFEELEIEIATLKEERDHWKTLALARSAAQE